VAQPLWASQFLRFRFLSGFRWSIIRFRRQTFFSGYGFAFIVFMHFLFRILFAPGM